MSIPPRTWYLLVVSLPTSSATPRMRIWRSVKTLGCGALRDGAYLLPGREDQRREFVALVQETRQEGGGAWLLTVTAQDDAEEQAYQALFDRTADYARFMQALSEQRAAIPTVSTADLTRAVRKLRREFDALASIDYFPNGASRQAEAALADFVLAADARLSPHEPAFAQREIARLDIHAYQKRLWATRRRLWVDRVASAWLIRRFIDPAARFAWLESPADCPPHALGVDFDGAAFSHVGDKVTFEVLMASFGLDVHPGLNGVAALVHTLDVGGAFVPEARGFEAMLAGARQRAPDDDALLEMVSPMLDSLYSHFSTEPPNLKR